MNDTTAPAAPTVDKEAEKAAAKAKREAEAAAKKAEKQKAKDEAKAKREADLAAKKAAKEAEKAAADAKREADKMPRQNDVRRPKPETSSGKAWAIFDDISAKNGSPASISEAMPVAKAAGLIGPTIRTQYARWRKFFGVSGRVEAPKPPAAPAS